MTACAVCNLSKGDKALIDWLRWTRDTREERWERIVEHNQGKQGEVPGHVREVWAGAGTGAGTENPGPIERDIAMDIDPGLIDELPHEIQHKFVMRFTREDDLRARKRLEISRIDIEKRRKRAENAEKARQSNVVSRLKRYIEKARSRHVNQNDIVE